MSALQFFVGTQFISIVPGNYIYSISAGPYHHLFPFPFFM